jgi:hypothetical protein
VAVRDVRAVQGSRVNWSVLSQGFASHFGQRRISARCSPTRSRDELMQKTDTSDRSTQIVDTTS